LPFSKIGDIINLSMSFTKGESYILKNIKKYSTTLIVHNYSKNLGCKYWNFHSHLFHKKQIPNLA
jgi:hypothetical protein